MYQYTQQNKPESPSASQAKPQPVLASKPSVINMDRATKFIDLLFVKSVFGRNTYKSSASRQEDATMLIQAIGGLLGSIFRSGNASFGTLAIGFGVVYVTQLMSAWQTRNLSQRVRESIEFDSIGMLAVSIGGGILMQYLFTLGPLPFYIPISAMLLLGSTEFDRSSGQIFCFPQAFVAAVLGALLCIYLPIPLPLFGVIAYLALNGGGRMRALFAAVVFGTIAMMQWDLGTFDYKVLVQRTGSYADIDCRSVSAARQPVIGFPYVTTLKSRLTMLGYSSAAKDAAGNAVLTAPYPLCSNDDPARKDLPCKIFD
jgi:hypothetical protein